jgi:hypothetical protein
MHAPLMSRLGAQLRLMRFGRFWKRVNPVNVLKNVDRMLS